MMLKGKLPPKINSYGNILPSYLLYIFEFQLVLFAFSLYFGRPFYRVSFPTPPKVCFSWGTNFARKIYRRIVLHGVNNDHIIPRGKEFYKMHFPVI